MKIRLRACKRCGGDLVPDGSDRYGSTLICLQCGGELMLSRRSAGTDWLLRSLSVRARDAESLEAVAAGHRDR